MKCCIQVTKISSLTIFPVKLKRSITRKTSRGGANCGSGPSPFLTDVTFPHKSLNQSPAAVCALRLRQPAGRLGGRGQSRVWGRGQSRVWGWDHGWSLGSGWALFQEQGLTGSQSCHVTSAAALSPPLAPPPGSPPDQ